MNPADLMRCFSQMTKIGERQISYCNLRPSMSFPLLNIRTTKSIINVFYLKKAGRKSNWNIEMINYCFLHSLFFTWRVLNKGDDCVCWTWFLWCLIWTKNKKLRIKGFFIFFFKYSFLLLFTSNCFKMWTTLIIIPQMQKF